MHGDNGGVDMDRARAVVDASFRRLDERQNNRPWRTVAREAAIQLAVWAPPIAILMFGVVCFGTLTAFKMKK
jgi:hypothetical protein